MKRTFNLSVSLILSVGLIWFGFRDVHPSEVARSLSQAHVGYVVLAVILGLVSFFGRALRWRALTRHLKPAISLRNLFSCTVIGFMLSYILPGKIGELARPILLAGREGISKGSAIGTVAVARMMDFLAVLLLLSIYLIAFSDRLPADGSGWIAQFRTYRTVLGIAVLAGVVALYAAVLAREPLFQNLERRTHPERWPRRVVDFFHALVRGFEILKGPKALVVGMLYTLASWVLIDLSILSCLKAFDVSMDFADVFLLIAFLAVGISVPTPGGVGGYQEMGKLCLTGIFRVESGKALAVAWAQWFIAVIPVVILGAILIWTEGMTVGQVGRMIRKEKETSP
ncbi:MAG TPA: lysylphosphatidylglycerol synthase transmembrane domain-containing protein [Candidatus Polarisedimenticolia bacterium]|nr:lysylphosphatidylglycerol synthase transmembrane domain-containing protein [Candidatus Polarisedimenticolia bacterium]